jgi:hypothetical protein
MYKYQRKEKPIATNTLFDPNPSGVIEHDHNNHGIDRRNFEMYGLDGHGVILKGVLKSYKEIIL